MRIKLFVFLSLIAIVVYKCRQESSLQDVLTEDCYWDILEKNSEHPINSCYKFNGDGRCNFFYYNFYDKKRTDSVFLYDDDDVVVPNTWELRNGSDLVIRGTEYRLLHYNSDSVFLKGRNDTIVLVKNCKTYHPKDRSIQTNSKTP